MDHPQISTHSPSMCSSVFELCTVEVEEELIRRTDHYNFSVQVRFHDSFHFVVFGTAVRRASCGVAHSVPKFNDGGFKFIAPLGSESKIVLHLFSYGVVMVELSLY